MEVLIYGNINQYTARDFITEVNAIGDGVCDVRVNTDGGSPEYGWGMIAKFAEFDGQKKVKVDGKAYSMGAFLCLYADEVEALDVSEFMVHRAAYPDWLESEIFNAESSNYNEGLKQNLININTSLEKAFRSKVDVEKFEAAKGIKVKEMFSLDGRKDVFLNAKEAKDFGFVTKINKITPTKKAEIDALGVQIAAKYTPEITGEKPVLSVVTNQQKPKKMTVEDFKKENPEAYNSIVAAGITQERERVKAHLVYADVDLSSVKASIENGEDLTASKMAELNRKMVSAAAIAGAEQEAPAATNPPAPAAATLTAEQKEYADLSASVGNFLKQK